MYFYVARSVRVGYELAEGRLSGHLLGQRLDDPLSNLTALLGGAFRSYVQIYVDRDVIVDCLIREGLMRKERTGFVDRSNRLQIVLL